MNLHRRLLVAWALASLCCAAIVPGGCGRLDSGPPKRSAALRVTATTGMVADLAKAIGGEKVAVTALMGEGVDPHLYKAAPNDLRLLEGADLVLYNGLHLEGKLAEVLERLARRRAVVAVAEAIDTSLLHRPAEFEGHPDPHVWFDVSLWIRCAEKVRDSMAERDPPNAEMYAANSRRYIGELHELDAWCRSEISKIPAAQRVLITAHDAFGYFGSAYGLEVHGIQGISTDSEASIRDINALVDLLVSRRIPAVFVESSVPRKTIDALVEGCRGRGHAVAVGGELYSDALGPAGTPEGTYVGMVRHNVSTIVRALAPDAPVPGGSDRKEPG